MQKDMTIKDFGKRMAKFRKAKGLTQQQLGDLIGVSRRVIAYYEAETKYLPAHLIVPLSKALSVSIEELLGIKEPQTMHDPKLAALWRRLRVLETFSDKDKKAVLQYVDVIAERNKAQQKTN